MDTIRWLRIYVKTAKKPSMILFLEVMREMIEQLYISISEACTRYGIGRTTLYQLFQMDGCPPALKLGGKTLLKVKDFDAFFAAQLEPAVVTQNKTKQKNAAAG